MESFSFPWWGYFIAVLGIFIFDWSEITKLWTGALNSPYPGERSNDIYGLGIIVFLSLLGLGVLFRARHASTAVNSESIVTTGVDGTMMIQPSEIQTFYPATYSTSYRSWAVLYAKRIGDDSGKSSVRVQLAFRQVNVFLSLSSKCVVIEFVDQRRAIAIPTRRPDDLYSAIQKMKKG